MVTLSAADRKMTDRELAKIGDVVRSLPIFADFDPEKLVPTAEACGALLQDEDGLDRVLGMIAALPTAAARDRLCGRRRSGGRRPPCRAGGAPLPADPARPARPRQLTVAAIERSARARYRTLS